MPIVSDLHGVVFVQFVNSLCLTFLRNVRQIHLTDIFHSFTLCPKAQRDCIRSSEERCVKQNGCLNLQYVGITSSSVWLLCLFTKITLSIFQPVCLQFIVLSVYVINSIVVWHELRWNGSAFLVRVGLVLWPKEWLTFIVVIWRLFVNMRK